MAFSGGCGVLPSHQTSPSGNRATLVKMVSLAIAAMALGLVCSFVPGTTPKYPASGLIARNFPVAIDPHPDDVVADGGDFPAEIAVFLRRNQHGEIGFSARAGEGRGDIGFFALGAGRAHQKHVLGHPFLLLAEKTGDAERQAFLPQQRIASVTRSETPDGVVEGKMADVPPFGTAIAEAVEASGEFRHSGGIVGWNAGFELLPGDRCPSES